MTYSDKLKDGRWLDFRGEYIARKRYKRGDWDNKDWCDDCGQDTSGPVHVHHRVYRDGKDPWQYDDEDLRLLCEDCHGLIHATEERARNLIRRLPPHCCYEFNDLLDELEAALKIGEEWIKTALAHSKNASRDVVCSIGQPMRIHTMRELAKQYLEATEDGLHPLDDRPQ